MNTIVDAFMKQVADHIESSGRAVVSIGGKPGAAQGYPFAYSVGHAERNLPELVMTTIIRDRATIIVNEVAAALDAQGWADAAGRGILLRNLAVRIVDTGCFGRQARVANYRASQKGVGAITFLQILWPDTAGLFPDHPGYDHLRNPQPLLREETGDAPHVT